MHTTEESLKQNQNLQSKRTNQILYIYVCCSLDVVYTFCLHLRVHTTQTQHRLRCWQTKIRNQQKLKKKKKLKTIIRWKVYYLYTGFCLLLIIHGSFVVGSFGHRVWARSQNVYNNQIVSKNFCVFVVKTMGRARMSCEERDSVERTPHLIAKDSRKASHSWTSKNQMEWYTKSVD